jgi:hypothetical protein
MPLLQVPQMLPRSRVGPSRSQPKLERKGMTSQTRVLLKAKTKATWDLSAQVMCGAMFSHYRYVDVVLGMTSFRNSYELYVNIFKL